MWGSLSVHGRCLSCNVSLAGSEVPNISEPGDSDGRRLLCQEPDYGISASPCPIETESLPEPARQRL